MSIIKRVKEPKMDDCTLTTIEVRFSEIAYHNWPDAPEHRAYLRSLHRHTFNIAVECVVTHNDRQVEFHDLLDAAIRAWPPSNVEETQMTIPNNAIRVIYAPTLGAMSCEMIATHIGEELRNNGYDISCVSVSEETDYTANVIWPHRPYKRL